MPHTGEIAAQHSRVKYHRGSASLQLCVDNPLDKDGSHPATDWSHVHGTDPDEIMNYVPRCRRHHYAYDRATKVLPVHDRPHTEEAKQKMREAVRPPVTEEARAAMRAAHAQRRAAATHCPNGHEWTRENTYREGARRKCRTCVRARQAAARALKRAQA